MSDYILSCCSTADLSREHFERIGVHYTIPSLRNLTVGVNIKAHRTKADLTELVVSYPIDL